MRAIKILLWAVIPVFAAALLAAVISSMTETGNAETIFSLFGVPLTVTGAGAGFSFLTIAGFAGIRLAGNRHREKTFSIGRLTDAAGFGVLPGAAVWKIFEQFTPMAEGIQLFHPLPALEWITEDNCFVPSRMEMILAVVCFAGIVIWLILRKKDFSWNGELPGVVLCIWGLIRALTESMRAFSLFYAGPVNLLQIIFLVFADIPMAFWTRRGRTKQKSTAFAVLEWIAVLSCETVLVLNTSGLLSVGSEIGDFAVNCGCVILSMLLILLTGKDSRS